MEGAVGHKANKVCFEFNLRSPEAKLSSQITTIEQMVEQHPFLVMHKKTKSKTTILTSQPAQVLKSADGQPLCILFFGPPRYCRDDKQKVDDLGVE